MLLLNSVLQCNSAQLFLLVACDSLIMQSVNSRDLEIAFCKLLSVHNDLCHYVLECAVNCVLCLLLTGFRHPGTYPKKPGGFFWVHPPKKPTPKNPHFYFNLILVYTLYATNNAIFYCF